MASTLTAMISKVDLANDDTDGSNSRIEVILPEAGNYGVVVSSFAGGETLLH